MTDEPKPPKTEGWTWIYGATKWHYFRKGKSLCGRWMLLGLGDFEEDEKLESEDNCKTCTKKRRIELEGEKT